jgi:hypothetical protein
MNGHQTPSPKNDHENRNWMRKAYLEGTASRMTAVNGHHQMTLFLVYLFLFHRFWLYLVLDYFYVRSTCNSMYLIIDK